jgi:predicted nucleic acid-binding protein
MNNPPVATVDANILLRYILDDNPTLSQKAAGIVEGMEDRRVILICDPVTLAEVAWVLTSFYKMPRVDIVESLLPIVKSPNFILTDKHRYLHALELFGGPVKHFGDACCCAAALEESGGALFSFDKALSKAPGITRREEIG